MEEFDEVSLDYFGPEYIGLMDREQNAVTPIPPPAMRIFPQAGGYRIILTDDRQKQYRLRRLIDSEAEAQAVFDAFSVLFEQTALNLAKPTITVVSHGTPYRSAKGVDLTLRVERRWVSPRANYWIYVVYAEMRNKTKQAWSVLIKKDHAASPEEADRVAIGDPLASVKHQLDGLEEGESRPLTVTQAADGAWTIV